MQKWIILIIISIIVVLGIVIILNVDIETEYTPETEIEDVELRKTIVTLYFKDRTSGELAKESRLIDSKELLKDPYGYLLKLLFDGPENTNYEKLIPEGTEVLETNLNSGCLEINLNKAFQEANMSEEDLNKAIYSIYNTLSELTEVNSIKVLIEGTEKDEISNVISRENLNIDNTNVVSNVVNNTTAENTLTL